MHGQQRVKQMGEADALGLGDEAEEGAVGVEGPGVGLANGLESGLVGTVGDGGCGFARSSCEGDLDGLGTQSLRGDHGDRSFRANALDPRVGLEVFELHRVDTVGRAIWGREGD